jgi:hypothetical protein
MLIPARHLAALVAFGLHSAPFNRIKKYIFSKFIKWCGMQAKGNERSEVPGRNEVQVI